MFLRRSLSLFLIGIGIGSPWLVRDWLAARSGAPEGGGVAWTERIRERVKSFGREDPPEPVDRAESAERKPYALASQTRRLVEGFFGGSGSGPGGGLSSFLPAGEPDSTPRSRAITEAETAHLAPQLAKLGLACGDPVVLRLFKEEGELEIWMKPSSDPLYTLFKVHRLSASAGRPGPKLREGDGQAPEGFYSIDATGLRPETRHHLGMDFGYPNTLDQYLGRGGSDMMIHAGAGAAGAYAVAPETMNEVYTLVDAAFRAGRGAVPVHLFPFRLTDKRMDRVIAEGGRWADEWINLKEGSDFFENVRLPPLVEFQAGRYAFRMTGDRD